jgi:hypothetical protein
MGNSQFSMGKSTIFNGKITIFNGKIHQFWIFSVAKPILSKPIQTDPRYSDTFDLHSALREQADHPVGISGAKSALRLPHAVAVSG